MNEELIRLLNDAPKITVQSIYENNGIKVPRVTEIISKCLHVDALMGWANSLGFKHMGYRSTLSRLAEIGTATHNNIDNFLSNRNIEPMMYNESEQAFLSFLKWWDVIHKHHTIEVLYHEQPLICRYFGGTMDGLYKIDGNIFLVDYKTSNNITIKHFLQLAAYRYILKTEMNIEIDGCMLLQLCKVRPEYTEHMLYFKDQNHLKFINDCTQTFLSMVYSYYNLVNVEAMYSDIKTGGM